MAKPTANHQQFSCRLGCGACCIAPSISSAIPGMPHGKPAGVRCVQLDENNLCRLFGLDSRPAVCLAFQACPSVCGESQQQAIDNIYELELMTDSNDSAAPLSSPHPAK